MSPSRLGHSLPAKALGRLGFKNIAHVNDAFLMKIGGAFYLVLRSFGSQFLGANMGDTRI